jgi:hypothetical protein
VSGQAAAVVAIGAVALGTLLAGSLGLRRARTTGDF